MPTPPLAPPIMLLLVEGPFIAFIPEICGKISS
ncbi:hypothetical protein CCUS01_11102 [Colletotrichum cuscutae]|uniref:Uncharacterized protein n=1 Tax=Colletotrichum cuscutae TaxID=1209917 RepID=A0AAI9U644_9PEZI|nr:hypothetical protein CCUS01_11102 [Colletotrichum cuscutae]